MLSLESYTYFEFTTKQHVKHFVVVVIVRKCQWKIYRGCFFPSSLRVCQLNGRHHFVSFALKKMQQQLCTQTTTIHRAHSLSHSHISVYNVAVMPQIMGEQRNDKQDRTVASNKGRTVKVTVVKYAVEYNKIILSHALLHER